MSRTDPKQLISVRVDREKYSQIRKILDKKNEGRYSWNAFTFSDIVDRAMQEYISVNEQL